MRIAIVSGWLFLPPYCGTRKIVYQTAINLGERGHKVILAMAENKSKSDKLKISQGNVDLEAVLVKKPFFDLYYITGMILGKMSDFFWAPLSNVLRSILLKLFWLNALYATIALFDPEMIMAEDMYAAPAALEVANRLGLPFVYHIHHIYSMLYLGHPFEKTLKKWELSVLKKADLLLTFTYEDKKMTKKMFGVGPQVTQCGIDLPDFNERAKAFELEASGYVLYVSSYLGKELSWLRKAATRFPNTTFIFVGRGSEASVELSKNIKRLGTVSERELATLYRYCRFVFIPLEWNPGQGFPIKLAEALRSNKPILLNKKASWLLPRTAAGVHTFTNDENLYKEIEFLLKKQQTITRNSYLFDWTIASRQLERQLEKILSKRKQKMVCT